MYINDAISDVMFETRVEEGGFVSIRAEPCQIYVGTIVSAIYARQVERRPVSGPFEVAIGGSRPTTKYLATFEEALEQTGKLMQRRRHGCPCGEHGMRFGAPRQYGDIWDERYRKATEVTYSSRSPPAESNPDRQMEPPIPESPLVASHAGRWLAIGSHVLDVFGDELVEAEASTGSDEPSNPAAAC